MKKEHIKDQMIKTAARLWNVPDNEIETNFDPLILLLIEACASELEKISYDINASHERLLDKLADLIIPESVIGPKPASCITTAASSELSSTVNAMTRFFVAQRIQNASADNSFNMNIFFTPVGDFLLRKARLAYTIVGKKIFKINSNTSKDLIYNGEGSNREKVNEVWFAMAPDKALKSIKGLSLYFDMRSHSKAHAFYNSLTGTKGWIGNQEVTLGEGYYNCGQFELNPGEMLVSGHDYTQKIHRQIAGIYQNHFLHIASDPDISSAEVPAEFQNNIPQQTLQKITAEPLVFLKIKLNRYFVQEELDGLTCSINAFPMVNRKFNTQNYRTDPWINIIPIQVEGSFLDLQSIITTTGGNYKFRVSADTQNIHEGEALIRSSGIGKINSREVREIISSLMDAIRDESAYFSEVNNDFILARLKEISQVLARLEDQLQKSADNRAAHNYILLKPKNPDEIVAINYWTTNGAIAHQIKPGTILTAYNHTLTGAKEVYIISNVAGGKTAISESEKRNLLKQQIISNGKIVSAEDIKILCAQLFGNRLTGVHIQKGVQIGTGASEGFSRSINIHLTLQDKEDPELDFLCRELKLALQNKATLVYPFNVIIE